MQSGGPRPSSACSHAAAPRCLTLLTLCLLALLLLPACGSLASASPSVRVLFIGNSFTYMNGGVERQLKGLDPSIETQSVTVGGYTLKDHWSGAARGAIVGSKWDYVVLQEQSQMPVTGRAQFLEYAARLAGEIRGHGAQPILFMTWQRPDSIQYGVTTQNLAKAYYLAGSQTGAPVAPVGLAFGQALQGKPRLQLYIEDGHPTLQGTYLAACVIYATIFDKSPVGNRFAPAGISADEKDLLQRVAAEITGH